ncbi:hypothetical protein L1987_23624 [Smallanthus sonchifolius]|uniref:Uncharacterized protein n=1 Tax=Smallanthus sonchifolius TaxID=185202 RepID=A0ACB9II79_9ASTR|nr:hypothetical protein L1987_23624 [Smallanthus sonchifolius]
MMQKLSVRMHTIVHTGNFARKIWRRFSKFKGKGKEPASGSADPPPKRNMRDVVIEDSDSDPMEEETEQIPKPQWRRNTPLPSLHLVWQEDLYREKIGALEDKESIFVCERVVALAEFRPLGMVECFNRLGWEAALSFHDVDGRDRILTKPIIQ